MGSIALIANIGTSFIPEMEGTQMSVTLNFNKEVSQEQGNDISDEFLILPSSVHELIFVPVFWLVTDLNQYKQMVADINSTEVSPQDKLTDSVYYYKDGVVTCY